MKIFQLFLEKRNTQNSPHRSSSKLISFIVLPHGKVTTELNERVKKFEVKMFKSGVSYHDYQVDLCQGMPLRYSSLGISFPC